MKRNYNPERQQVIIWQNNDERLMLETSSLKLFSMANLRYWLIW